MRTSWVVMCGAMFSLAACGAGGASAGVNDTGTTSTAVTTLATTSTRPPSPATSAQVMCGTVRAGSRGVVGSPELTEISGVAASRREPGVLWVHNDSGGRAAVYALDLTGTTRARVDVTNAVAVDWEDIAIGPGPDAATHLFVADIGDNAASRERVMIYRFPEPALAATAVTADAVTLRYPDRPHDAEAFMVHPVTGDWYLLTKERSDASTLFRAAKPGPGSSTVTLEPLTTISVQPDFVTGGDISPDGSALAIRTYLSVRVYPITGGDVAGALAGPPCRGPALREGQGEAIAFGADGRTLVTISEGANPAVNVIG